MFFRIVKVIKASWKWLVLTGFIILAVIGWDMRFEIFHFMHIDKLSFLHPIYKFIISALYAIVCTCLFIGIVKWARVPIILQAWYKRGFEKIGFKNSLGAVPLLRYRRIDKCKAHGIIYEFENVGLSVNDFENNIGRIQAVVNGIVYGIEYSQKKMSRTLLYVMPKKYATPIVISLDSVFLCAEPNLLCVGKTNSGKSYALATILGIYAEHIPDVSITICDYKKSSFSQFDGMPNFYGFEDVPNGIRTFHREFQARLAANDAERNKQIRVLLIDEYGALIAAQDKKTAEELKMIVGNMLFMGRSLGIKVLIGIQRADAEHFRAGARDQFRAILALGNLSKEQKQMLFTDNKESMNDINRIGEGYLHIDGQELERVRIATIDDLEMMNESIRSALYH